MDNQPLQTTQNKQPVQPQPASQPTNIPGNYTNPSTPVNTDTGDVVLEAGKKKRKKLIITLASIFAVLLVGGGAFAVAAIISNQPENIAMSAFSNLINAKQIAASGTIDLTISESENIGVEAVKINLEEQASGISHATTANLEIDFTNGTEPATLELGETMLSDGVLYVKANGLQDFYNGPVYENAYNAIISQVQNGYSANPLEQCDAYIEDTDMYSACISVINDPTIAPEVDSYVRGILDQIGSIIQPLDGQWIRISVEEIMNSELLGEPNQEAIETYNCLISTLNNSEKYSKELSDLYGQNSFVTLTKGQDSFYDISLDSNKLTGYLNAIPNTQLVSDIASCSGETLTSDETAALSTEDIDSFLAELPQISAKFDGLFNHHLTELRINKQDTSYTFNADLNFTYPTNVNISEPEGAESIIDVLTNIMQQMNEIGTQTQEEVIVES